MLLAIGRFAGTFVEKEGKYSWMVVKNNDLLKYHSLGGQILWSICRYGITIDEAIFEYELVDEKLQPFEQVLKKLLELKLIIDTQSINFFEEIKNLKVLAIGEAIGFDFEEESGLAIKIKEEKFYIPQLEFSIYISSNGSMCIKDIISNYNNGISHEKICETLIEMCSCGFLILL